MAEPKNLEAPIGALVEDLLAFCGGGAAALLMGGDDRPSAAGTPVPIVKGTARYSGADCCRVAWRRRLRPASAAGAASKAVRQGLRPAGKCPDAPATTIWTALQASS